MWLNCEVIKKLANPHFHISFHFSGLPFPAPSPFFSKNFDTTQVTQFLEGPNLYSLFGKEGRFNEQGFQILGEGTFFHEKERCW